MIKKVGILCKKGFGNTQLISLTQLLATQDLWIFLPITSNGNMLGRDLLIASMNRSDDYCKLGIV